LPRHLVIFALLALAGCHRQPEGAKPVVTVAAAANLTAVFQQAGPRFEAETGIHPVFSFASTAQLAQQIENSAPFDVFAAADTQHVDELIRRGFLTPESRAVYARGVLALWIPPRSQNRVMRVEDLDAPEVQVIAIAKPELAPYGAAAVATLTRLGLWDKVKDKVVYAENINMAKEYGASRNADAVFTAYSLVLRERGRVLKVDENLHSPIDQELGIVAKSPRQYPARKFVAFLLTGDGRAILSSFGYLTPAGR
jgi:molybdate transport system substrate-binding protein